MDVGSLGWKQRESGSFMILGDCNWFLLSVDERTGSLLDPERLALPGSEASRCQKRLESKQLLLPFLKRIFDHY